MYSVLALMGPHSGQILARAAGLEDSVFETFMSWKPNEAKKLDIGCAIATAVRTSYVGEGVGWELFLEADMAQHAFEALHESAAELSVELQNAGYLAMDSLRIEAGRLAWGHELTPDETPLQAGLGFAVKLGKLGGFLGEQALRAQSQKPLSKRCCLFEMLPDMGGPYVWGGEPILLNGEYSGENVTSGARVPLDNSCRTLALGYVIPEDGQKIDQSWLASQRVEIEVGSRLVPVTTTLLPRRR